MNIQKLYNELRIKREFGLGDVVTRLSYDEVDILLEGLRELGADTNAGYEYLQSFKREVAFTIKDNEEREIRKVFAYYGLRVKVKVGKYKGWIGFVESVNQEKKPLKVVFASGERQKYQTEQIELVESDRGKYDKKLNGILFEK